MSYFCDVCRQYPILGPRFHCSECSNWDACGACAKAEKHDPAHTLVEVTEDSDGRFQREFLENVGRLFEHTSNAEQVKTSGVKIEEVLRMDPDVALLFALGYTLPVQDGEDEAARIERGLHAIVSLECNSAHGAHAAKCGFSQEICLRCELEHYFYVLYLRIEVGMVTPNWLHLLLIEPDTDAVAFGTNLHAAERIWKALSADEQSDIKARTDALKRIAAEWCDKLIAAANKFMEF